MTFALVGHILPSIDYLQRQQSPGLPLLFLYSYLVSCTSASSYRLRHLGSNVLTVYREKLLVLEAQLDYKIWSSKLEAADINIMKLHKLQQFGLGAPAHPVPPPVTDGSRVLYPSVWSVRSYQLMLPDDAYSLVSVKSLIGLKPIPVNPVVVYGELVLQWLNQVWSLSLPHSDDFNDLY